MPGWVSLGKSLGTAAEPQLGAVIKWMRECRRDGTGTPKCRGSLCHHCPCSRATEQTKKVLHCIALSARSCRPGLVSGAECISTESWTLSHSQALSILLDGRKYLLRRFQKDKENQNSAFWKAIQGVLG